MKRTEREKEEERGEVVIGGEGIHRTDTSLWLCCMPPGYPVSHRLHPSPFLPYLYPSLSLPLSLIDATQLVSPRLSVSFPRSLSLSLSLLSSLATRHSFVLTLGRRCAASGLLVPLCSRSFVQYSMRERGRGGWQRPGGEKRRRRRRQRRALSRAQTQRTHGTRFHRWLVGYGWFVRTIETSPAKGEPRERSGKTPGFSLALMWNETMRSIGPKRAGPRERRIGRTVSE